MAEVTSTDMVMRGDIGIPLVDLSADRRCLLEQQLTCQPEGWNEEVPEPICCLMTDHEYAWVPRYFDLDYWDGVASWEWTRGEPYPFRLIATLDPDRDQHNAVPAMVSYIQRHSGGILVSPTGTGKSLMGYAIAAPFERKIGILVYKGDMFDNWTYHAKIALGLEADQVGVVKQDRCDIGKPVTLLSIQTLLSRGVPEPLRHQIGFLIADEIQHFGARKWREVTSLFTAQYRLGLSADPTRGDGTDPVIGWSFGHTGYKAKRIRKAKGAQAPDCVMVEWLPGDYKYSRYCRWKKQFGVWRPGDPDPMKYDKVLAKDKARTRMFAREIGNALAKDRAILVLSRYCDHRDEVFSLVKRHVEVENLQKRVGCYESGLTKAQREDVFDADAIFATYSMARDATNIPKLDTLVFLTPPGDLTQPAGRLREKDEEGIERKSLLIVDGFEGNDYSRHKASRREGDYRRLGIRVIRRRRSK